MILLSRAKRLERHVVDLVEHKRWEEARDFLRRNPRALPERRTFLRDKIEREADFSGSEAGKRLAEHEFVRERIAAHLDDAAWAIVGVSDIPGGLIGSRNLKITLENRDDGSILNLFEKIYNKHDKNRSLMETYLFEDIDSEALLSPRFYGAYRHEDFISLLFCYINGVGVSNAREHRIKAVRTLWNTRPSARLVKRYGRRLLPSIGRATGGALFARLAAESGMAGRRFLDSQRLLADDLPRIFADVPMCIMHEDMRPQNFLTSRSTGKTYLIDWEKWNVRPVGFGMRLKAEEFEDFLGDQSARPEHVDFPAFRFMVSLGSLLHHLEMHRANECAAWLPVVARELDALA